MKILVIGSGGREHALCWKMRGSTLVEKVYCAPGNAGISKDDTCIDIKATDINGLLRFARSEEIDITVVGPEIPLSIGIVDRFMQEDQRIFGPSKQASQIEISKVFCKNLMKKYNIPSAFYSVFDDFDTAVKWIEEVKPPLVVKADGLAAGKGVFICRDVQEAVDALNTIMRNKVFGESGNRVVIEEFLEGEEVSFFAFTDGKNILPLESSQDHKALLDGDKGPNTGGMGAYSPAPLVTEELREKIINQIMVPTLDALNNEGIDYKGILYAGLMIQNSEPKVLEFNCRFGDPEAQPLLMRMKTDIVPIINAVVDSNLSGVEIEWYDESSVCVVLASKGYPGDYKKGYEIRGLEILDNISGINVFHSGTIYRDDSYLTNGGRVLGVTSLGKDIKQSIKAVYNAIEKIDCEHLFYRSDIGSKALKYL
ncbi:MAG: phosphoribosylamine--glycine ligase [Thermodesulfobacteriota bacterium]